MPEPASLTSGGLGWWRQNPETALFAVVAMVVRHVSVGLILSYFSRFSQKKVKERAAC